MPTPPFPTAPLTTLPPPNPSNPSPINALTFSSGTGSYILTGSSDRTVRLYNPTAPAKPIQSYSAHGYEVLDLAVSADNAKFVSVGGDKTVFVWDVATAVTLRRFGGHMGRVEACALGGEGGSAKDGVGESVVVSGSYDGTVKVWDLRSRSEKAIMSFNEARDAVSSVAVRGGEVYAGSVDCRVRVYDLAMGCVDVDVMGASVTSVTPALAGDSYLVSTLDSKLRLMDRGSGRCLQTFKDEGSGFKNESYRVRSTLAVGDAVAVCGGEDGRVVVWDVLSGEIMHRLWHKEDGEEIKAGEVKKRDVVSAVAWNAVRRQWASAGADGRVVVWGADR